MFFFFLYFYYFFFFKQKTAYEIYQCDWSSDVCSSDLDATRILIPGYCEGDTGLLESATDLPVEKGPRDLMQLPSFFATDPLPADYGGYDIEIIAEINHCPQLSLQEILRHAAQLTDDGADVIDVGCDPDGPWPGVALAVAALRELGRASCRERV